MKCFHNAKCDGMNVYRRHVEIGKQLLSDANQI